MWSYILKRFLLMIPTGIGIVTVFFAISELVPGGPLDQVEAMIIDQANKSGVGDMARFGEGTAPGALQDRSRNPPADQAQARPQLQRIGAVSAHAPLVQPRFADLVKGDR